MAHPAHFIALGFGAGLIPYAPGTFGTLASLVLYLALAQVATPAAIALLAIPLFFVGVWACGVTGRDLAAADHGAMVWDELVAFLPLAAMASGSAGLLALAFVLFRLFDIWKPFPIAQLERRLKGGLGVMVDDALAAAYVAVVLGVLLVAYPRFGSPG